ncbi:hypothetical protein EAE96_009024 [Botrytis aclada]|nr:hypothetical protein EAE96_009024 [Botrytis aclada]
MSSSTEIVNLTYKRGESSNLTPAPVTQRSESFPFLNLPNEVVHTIFKQLLKEAQEKSSKFSNYGIQTRCIKDALNMLSVSKDVRNRCLPEFYRETLIPIALDLEKDNYLGYPETFESEGGWSELVDAADFNFGAIPSQDEHASPPGHDGSDGPRLVDFLLHHGSQIRRIKLNISNIGDKAGSVLIDEKVSYRKFEWRIKDVVEQLLGNGEGGTPRAETILELSVCIQPDRDYPISEDEEQEGYDRYKFECACFNIVMSLLEPLREHLDSEQCAKLDWNGIYVLKATDINSYIFSYENISFLGKLIGDLATEDQNARSEWAEEQSLQNDRIPQQFVTLPVERNEDQWITFWRNRMAANPYRLACLNFLYPRGISQARNTQPAEFQWVLKILEASSLIWNIHEIRLILDLLRERKRRHGLAD